MSWRGLLGLALVSMSVSITPEAVQSDAGLIGPWGGGRIRMAVTSGGATVEYDCAAGAIDEPIRPDHEGNFEVRGTHALRPSSGAPGEPTPERHAAVFKGWTNREEMRLTVTLADTGRAVGEFTLGHGRPAELGPCLLGTWGGEHVRLLVKERGATIEYDCAAGTIDEPLNPDTEGRFEVRGTHVFEQGGPRRTGEPQPRLRPALYQGWTDGARMRLTVSLPDTSRDVGTFSLGLGQRATLEKCL